MIASALSVLLAVSSPVLPATTSPVAGGAAAGGAVQAQARMSTKPAKSNNSRVGRKNKAMGRGEEAEKNQAARDVALTAGSVAVMALVLRHMADNGEDEAQEPLSP